jgi:aminoglycoside phosphotransferase (APT) family kinase protein
MNHNIGQKAVVAGAAPRYHEGTQMMIPPDVETLLYHAFPAAAPGPAAPTSGGFSHPSFYILIDGRCAVVKAARAPEKRADLRNEARAIAGLRGSGLPTPELLGLAEGDGLTLEAQRALPGASGVALFGGPAAALREAYIALGQLLAAVHRTSAPAGLPILAERAAAAVAALAGLCLPAALERELAAALAHPAWRAGPPRLVHGDAGLHNILWAGRITGLLDWEWAAAGGPLFDLAWLRWTMRWRGVDPALWEALLAAYGGAPPGLDAGALRALALGQIAMILGRVRHDPAASAEWLRRLRWTAGPPWERAAGTTRHR